MAYHFLYPEKDTTIYSHPKRQTLNTGIVETLFLDSERGYNSTVWVIGRSWLNSVAYNFRLAEKSPITLSLNTSVNSESLNCKSILEG